MWNPLKRLTARSRKPERIPTLLSPEQEAELRAAQDAFNKPPKPKAKGRVIKQTRSVEFNPNPLSGGRVVRVMPHKLQKIKQAQEKFEDEQIPNIED